MVTVSAVLFLLSLKYQTTGREFFKTPLFILMALLFLLLGIGLSYTSNLKQGLAELEKNVALLLFPFLAYQFGKLNTKLSYLLWAFTVGCLAISILGFLYLFLIVDPAQREVVLSNGHSYYSELIKLHPTYFSIYLIIVFFFQLSYLQAAKITSWYKKAGVVLIILYVVTIIIFLRSRIAVSVYLICLLLYASIIFFQKSRAMFLSLLTVILAATFLFKNRLYELAHVYGRNAELAYSSRLQVWKSSYEGFMISPVVGAGTGAAQNAIDEGYLKVGYHEGLDNTYNAHNQYLQFLCSNGILGLALFLVILFTLTTTSIRRNNLLFFIFIVSFCFGMVSESMLYVQKGIVCFYFFAACFYYLKND